MADDYEDEYEDEYDDEEGEDEDFDDAPSGPKRKRKPGMETALLGLSLLALVVATYAVMHKGWAQYDMKWNGLFPEKVKQTDVEETGRIVSLYSQKGADGFIVSDMRVDDIVEMGEPYVNAKMYSVVLDRGANHGVREGEVWTAKTNMGTVYLVVAQVLDDYSICHVRPAWDVSEAGQSAVPRFKVSKDEQPEARKASAESQFILKHTQLKKAPK